MHSSLRDQFLLDPSVVFLNHGSFGACPTPVFQVYQDWQRQLERQPVDFLLRRHDALLAQARAALAAYLGADEENLVFVANATTAINTVARSLPLGPDDEILTTDHEYGAVDRTWSWVSKRTGAHILRYALPNPVTTHEDFVTQFWQQVTPRTRVISISHITSPSALILPVAEICRRARAAGILTVIDGAHAPGQIPLDLRDMDPDFYAGNCHKWMCAPKGAGFLYVRPEHHAMVDPLVISWGYDAPDATLAKRHDWQGTRDIAAWLSVPAAIDFMQGHNWAAVQARCHELAAQARARIAELTQQEHIAPDGGGWFAQMAACPLPDCDAEAVQEALWQGHRVEVPVTALNGLNLLRVSVQAYNTEADIDALLDGLADVLDLTDSRALSLERYGRYAAGYVSSQTHAKGSDLELLLALAGPQPGRRMLDVATGGGHTALKFAPLMAQVIATDLTPAMLAAARDFTAPQAGNILYSTGEAGLLPFAAGSFDLVTCRIAAHHFPDCAQFLAECRRVLRPGGLLLFQDHVLPEEPAAARYVDGFEKLRDPSHNRAYSQSEWLALFQGAGFTVEHVDKVEKRHELDDWARRQGADDTLIARLAELLDRAPAAAAAWLNVRDAGTPAASFTNHHIIIAAGKMA